METELNLTLWNIKWTRPGTKRGAMAEDLLFQGDPHVICVTEGYPGTLSHGGFTLLSDADHGYKTTDDRRKVMLWSQKPWSSVNAGAELPLPPGRFIAGITRVHARPVRFIGVCIPWKDAHVNTGQRNRERWQDHLSYLNGLENCLRSLSDNIPTIIVGDFNQRIPRTQQPELVYKRLMSVIEPDYSVLTSGVVPGIDALSIDHVAVSKGIHATSLTAFSNVAACGTELSDHFGLRLGLSIESPEDCRKTNQ